MTCRMYDAFLTYIRCELALSARTVSTYTSALRQWREFVADHYGPAHDPAATTVGDIRLWVAAMAARGVQARTIAKLLSALRSFFRFMCERHGMVANPAADIHAARVRRTLPAVIRPEDTARVLDAPLDTGDFGEVHRRLVMLMLYSTGMRASELLGLRDDAVDLGRRELKVLGKRNKERIIPFGDELSRMITLYRSLRPASTAPTLFVDTRGRPLRYRALLDTVHGSLVGRVRAARTTPHVMRHSFATDMLNSGASLTAVQQLLGHASLATNQIYTHLSYREIQPNYQLAHPRAQKKG